MHFERNSLAYLIIIISVATFGFMLSGPFYEVLTDISVSPPEVVRKTDFSWITVNEWFNGQTYLITSHVILKNADDLIEESKLKKIISAKRIGAADIIRISARSADNIETLVSVVDAVAKAYMDVANKDDLVITPPVEGPSADSEAYSRSLNKERDDLSTRISFLRLAIDKLEQKAAAVQLDIKKGQDLSRRAAELDRDIEKSSLQLEQLKKVYTENWSSVSELTSKINVLKEERNAVSTELERAKRLEAENLALTAEILSSKRELESLGSEKAVLEKKINEISRMPVSRGQMIDMGNEEKYMVGMSTFIINPTTVNFLPDMGLQILYGMVTGVIVWLLAGLLLKFYRKENRDKGAPPIQS